VYDIDGKRKDEFNVFSKHENLEEAIENTKNKKGHFLVRKNDRIFYDNKQEPCVIETDFDVKTEESEEEQKENSFENNGYYIDESQDFDSNVEAEVFDVDLKNKENWPKTGFPFLVPRDDSYDKEADYLEEEDVQAPVIPVEPKTVETKAYTKYDRFYKEPKVPKTDYQTYGRYPRKFNKRGKKVKIEKPEPPNMFETEYFSTDIPEVEEREKAQGVGQWEALISAIPVIGSMFQKQPEVKTTQKQQYVQQSANQVWPWILIGTTTFVTLTVLGYLLGQRISAKKARRKHAK